MRFEKKQSGQHALGRNGRGRDTEFRFFYNQVRPHQHLQGRTPQEVWDDGGRDVNPRHYAPTAARYFSAWGGLLTGYYIRR